MLYNYIIHIRHNTVTKETTYERLHYNKKMRYEIILGLDSIIEIIYFLSLKNQFYRYDYQDKNEDLITVSFIFKQSLLKFEDELYDFLHKHKCSII